MRRATTHRLSRCLSIACLALVNSTPALATDLSPLVVGGFTRRIQPLLINSCAAGACHGGDHAPAFRLQRAVGRSTIDRTTTLANLQAFLDAVGPQRDPHLLVELLSRRHPGSADPGTLTARPLSGQQRATLETWLRQVRSEEQRRPDGEAVRLVSGGTTTTPARPNRFRDLLDAATNPPELPPPQQPRGIIFGPVDQPETP